MLKNILFLAITFMFIFFCNWAFCQDYTANITVFSKSGEVMVLKSGTKDWQAVTVGMQLGLNDQIKTYGGSYIELKLDNVKNIIGIKESSEVAIGQTTKVVQINLKKGDMFSLLRDLKSDDFKVRTPTAVAGVRGTGFDSMAREERSEFNAHQDSIYVSGIDERGNVMEKVEEIAEGFSTEVDRLENPSAAKEIAEKDKEEWKSWKTDVETRSENAAAQEQQKQQDQPPSGGGPSGPSATGPTTQEQGGQATGVNPAESADNGHQVNIQEENIEPALSQKKAELENTAVDTGTRRMEATRELDSKIEALDQGKDIGADLERVEDRTDAIEARTDKADDIAEERQITIDDTRREATIDSRTTASEERTSDSGTSGSSEENKYPSNDRP